MVCPAVELNKDRQLMEIVSLSYTEQTACISLSVISAPFSINTLSLTCKTLLSNAAHTADWSGGGLESWLDWIVLFDDFNAPSLSEV